MNFKSNIKSNQLNKMQQIVEESQKMRISENDDIMG